uniref:Uncharacterized protein n=1 Tax=Tanacetum cinerariifolium TaxID=118510 RepID=A0A699GRQ2_TANCI|nr:hypothetical protein [Tanacetum cinerariifolium]
MLQPLSSEVKFILSSFQSQIKMINIQGDLTTLKCHMKAHNQESQSMNNQSHYKSRLPSTRTGKEVDIGLDGGRDKPLRPADMLLYSWDRGLDVCVDLTVSSPFTQTGMANFVAGREVIDAAQRKCVKYEAKCATIGYGFLPFSFSSLGELQRDAVTLLKRIRKFSMTQDVVARAAIHIFNRIGFVIAKEVGAQLVSRLPANFL